MPQSKGFFTSLRSRFERNRIGELLVQRGKLTPEQLRIALQTQKDTGKNFGSVVRDLKFVTKSDIRTTLFEQAAYRGIAASLTIFISISSMGMANQAKAAPLTPQQQSMVQKVAYHPDSNTPKVAIKKQKLFGTREIASKDISAFKKWTGILDKLNDISFNDANTFKFKDMPLSAKVSAVNEYVNKFKYIEDKENFGKSDYWATPSEFFARGGDCEDFAIAKYAMLKELGVAENQMRLAIVQDKIKNIPHAVLIVYTENGAMLLDNQIKKTSKVANIDRYKPIYSINAQGWWRHIS